MRLSTVEKKSLESYLGIPYKNFKKMSLPTREALKGLCRIRLRISNIRQDILEELKNDCMSHDSPVQKIFRYRIDASYLYDNKMVEMKRPDSNIILQIYNRQMSGKSWLLCQVSKDFVLNRLPRANWKDYVVMFDENNETIKSNSQLIKVIKNLIESKIDMDINGVDRTDSTIQDKLITAVKGLNNYVIVIDEQRTEHLKGSGVAKDNKENIFAEARKSGVSFCLASPTAKPHNLLNLQLKMIGYDIDTFESASLLEVNGIPAGVLFKDIDHDVVQFMTHTYEDRALLGIANLFLAGGMAKADVEGYSTEPSIVSYEAPVLKIDDYKLENVSSEELKSKGITDDFISALITSGRHVLMGIHPFVTTDFHSDVLCLNKLLGWNYRRCAEATFTIDNGIKRHPKYDSGWINTARVLKRIHKSGKYKNTKRDGKLRMPTELSGQIVEWSVLYGLKDLYDKKKDEFELGDFIFKNNLLLDSKYNVFKIKGSPSSDKGIDIGIILDNDELLCGINAKYYNFPERANTHKHEVSPESFCRNAILVVVEPTRLWWSPVRKSKEITKVSWKDSKSKHQYGLETLFDYILELWKTMDNSN
ncbi:MAG: hypothetical protein GPJ52_02800 [Candidatus Heimdallarchaeota archaeon]|nr:hypothetical protein [Candidatus Heimdallarchaeota archaeon]